MLFLHSSLWSAEQRHLSLLFDDDLYSIVCRTRSKPHGQKDIWTGLPLWNQSQYHIIRTHTAHTHTGYIKWCKYENTKFSSNPRVWIPSEMKQKPIIRLWHTGWLAGVTLPQLINVYRGDLLLQHQKWEKETPNRTNDCLAILVLVLYNSLTFQITLSKFKWP